MAWLGPVWRGMAGKARHGGARHGAARLGRLAKEVSHRSNPKGVSKEAPFFFGETD